MNKEGKKNVSKDDSIYERRRCWICEEIHRAEKTIDKVKNEIILRCNRTEQDFARFPLDSDKIPKNLYYEEFLKSLNGDGDGEGNQ